VTNASNSTAIEALTGNGTALQHSAGLSWQASTSVVAGYNVYRGINSGGPYSKISATLDTTTSYADNSVQPGQAYYYVATAVDANGRESAFSNEIPAVIPNP
jgi:fibronectin type 3 domain-containing protein